MIEDGYLNGYENDGLLGKDARVVSPRGWDHA